jgi:hexosaminidase
MSGNDNKSVVFFRELVNDITGIELPEKAGKFHTLPISFHTTDRYSENPESYRLSITHSKITIESPSGSGQFWAVQTLHQLMLFYMTKNFELPCVTILDEPDWAWRGNMLDVCRHFFPVDTIKRHLDILSFYKINTFHWHLTEDQGWRIEIKKHPLLTEIGAWRKKPDGSMYGGFYTQEEIREIVSYASARNINIIPEIEMPGHCRAALAAYPHLGCTKINLPVPDYFGVFQDVYCAGQEETFDFLEDVLVEVIDLFPYPYLHIGGDEVPKERWSECPACQKIITEEGLADEYELQSYFIRRIQGFLESRGKKMIGWDEILEGGADKTAVIEVWRGEEKAIEALNNGNKILQTLYFDSPPASLTLEKTYNYDPSVMGKTERILGAECPLWTEWVNSMNLDYMMYPRLQAFAEALWTKGDDFTEFRKRMDKHYKWMDKKGILYGAEDKNLLKTRIKYNPQEMNRTVIAEFGLPEMYMNFYFDDKEKIQSFRDTLTFSRYGKINLVPMRGEVQAAPGMSYTIHDHLAVGKKAEFLNPYSGLYSEPGEFGLTDGIMGSQNFRDGNWLGWQEGDLDVVIDLEKETDIKYISLNCMQQTQSWILLPAAVEFLISNDGKNWKSLAVLSHDVEVRNYDHILHAFSHESQTPVNTRYLRVKAKNYGRLPDWHLGSGGQAWIFADELVLR